MNIARRAVVATALLTGLGLGLSAYAVPIDREFGPNLVANGGFETGDLTGWTVWGNADTGNTGVDSLAPHSGTFALFSGPVGSVGGIQQDLATVVGTYYNIHLWLQNQFPSNASQFFVEWGIGNTVYSSVDDGEYPYKEIIIDQLATSGTTTVRIGFRNDAAYFDMDDVTVRAVPEPVSAALLGLGLIGLGFMRRNVKP